MLVACPECCPVLRKQGRNTMACFLDRVHIFTQFPEAGQCPLCNKVWNEDGKEIIVTGSIKVELKARKYNPSRREDE